MDGATSPAIAERAAVWSDARVVEGGSRRARRPSWSAVRDPLFTFAAVATILACVFGVGPFERPEGSHETFLASQSTR